MSALPAKELIIATNKTLYRTTCFCCLLLMCLGADYSLGGDSRWDSLKRGVTISCPEGGRIWATAHMDQTLADIKSHGFQSAAIHPYARITRDGAVKFNPQQTDYIGRALKKMIQSNLTVVLKPHLAYWGQFSWRGDISFDSPKKWQRFFEGYQKFILFQAQLAEKNGVDILVIGTELGQTLIKRLQWLKIIAKVRKVYKGKITYAANWDRIDDVSFWPQLDFIGVQSYFPLVATKPSSGNDLNKAWHTINKKLKAKARALDKKVLFTEIGYARSQELLVKPWLSGLDTSLTVTRLRYQAVLAAQQNIESSDWIVGALWWKWMPGYSKIEGARGYYLSGNDRDFSIRDPEVIDALNKSWQPRRPVLGAE